MSHYTMQSGKATVTRSLYCPACRHRQTLTPARAQELAEEYLFVPTEDLYCSQECQDTHTTQLVLDVAQHVALFRESYSHDLHAILQGALPDWIGDLLARQGSRS
jgi:hypothetical protein